MGDDVFGSGFIDWDRYHQDGSFRIAYCMGELEFVAYNDIILYWSSWIRC